MPHSQAAIERILERLGETDDPDFWRVALTEILDEAAFLCAASNTKTPIVAQIGACSHWVRPNQYRWIDGGGFAAPFGYGGGGRPWKGLPEFDWSERLAWDFEAQSWAPSDLILGGRRLTLRIALPTRTRRHPQGAIHTQWTPGSPVATRAKLHMGYGYRRLANGWTRVAERGSAESYELATAGGDARASRASGSGRVRGARTKR